MSQQEFMVRVSKKAIAVKDAPASPEFLPVFTRKARTARVVPRLSQDTSTEVEMETTPNKVGLPQEHEAAPQTCHSSEV